MKKSQISAQSSFTLIELLIVIAIIAIIAGAVLVAVNPAKRLAQAQDSRRWSEVQSIATAISTSAVDHGGQVPNCTNISQLIPADGVWRWVGDGTQGSFKGGTWLMEGNANDSSGNLNNGTVNGATPLTGGGKFGDAYSFDGSDDNILILDNINGTLDFDNDNEITIMAWIKVNSAFIG